MKMRQRIYFQQENILPSMQKALGSSPHPKELNNQHGEKRQVFTEMATFIPGFEGQVGGSRGCEGLRQQRQRPTLLFRHAGLGMS